MAAVQVQAVNHKKYFVYRTFKMKDESTLSERLCNNVSLLVFGSMFLKLTATEAQQPWNRCIPEWMKKKKSKQVLITSQSLYYLFLTVMGLGTQL